MELEAFFAEKANVYVSAGSGYGKEGNDFIRLNPACPRSVLKETLSRMDKAVHRK